MPAVEVAEDVAVQVRHHQHVVVLRPLHELHAHVVDDPVVEVDLRVVAWRPPARPCRNRPSLNFMMLALWTEVTSLRSFWLGRNRRRSVDDARGVLGRDRS